MVTIISDTTASIPVPVAQALGIPYLPQTIIFGEKSYRDDTELDTKTFLQMLRTSPVLPKTAAPAPALYRPIYERLLAEGQSIVVLTPSAEISGTYRGAAVAAQDFPDADIHVVDTRTVAGGLAGLVYQALEWAQEGKSAIEIVAGIEEMAPRNRIIFMVDTLEFLHKGGRIGGAQALFGGILQVKPILTLKDGHIEALESQRTQRRAFARLRELVETQYPRGSKHAYLNIMHGDAAELANQLATDLQASLGVSDIPIYELPPAILTHAGPGPIAVSFFTE